MLLREKLACGLRMACLNALNGRFAWVRSQPGEPAGFSSDVLALDRASNAVRFTPRMV